MQSEGATAKLLGVCRDWRQGDVIIDVLRVYANLRPAHKSAMHAQPSWGANRQRVWNMVLGIRNCRAARVDNVAKWAATRHRTHAALGRATVLASDCNNTWLLGWSRIFGACYRRI